MDFLPDVLDHLGKTPREFGALHAHFESVKLDVPGIPELAERIRPAWKLHDTFEIPKLSEMNPSTQEPIDTQRFGFQAAAFLTLGPLGAAVLSRVTRGPGMTGADKNTVTRMHKARELPRGLLCSVEAADLSALEGIVVETVWIPGQDLPESIPSFAFKPAVSDPNHRRHCTACGFAGKLSEYDRDRTCPTCGNYW